nr:RecName: Full=Salmocidin-2A [Oncorhynchus mykiss]
SGFVLKGYTKTSQ